MSFNDSPTRSQKIPEPCIMVIFGVTGDLTSRKLIPALYNLAREGQLPAQFACVGFARREKDDQAFRQEMKEAVNNFSREKPVNEKLWENFSNQLYYHQAEFHDDKGYETLREKLSELDKKHGSKGNRVFYLSTPPSYFPEIVKKLSEHQLIYNVHAVSDKWSRVIIEKPFGEDLKSAIALQENLIEHLDESQIYRIDHYLGKETVQNLFVFRFSNPIFEYLFNNHHVDNIQISVFEEIGIGSRGKFWEEAGLLRDIVQNHMMQLLSLIAMEAPSKMQSSYFHDEKVKVLESIRHFKESDWEQHAIRGQYGKGIVDGKEVKAYREEENVDPHSNVETYAALELFVDNWRWEGVPFYLRAGKRLAKKTTEIAVAFKHPPGFVSKQVGEQLASNVILIRIQPDEGISLRFNCKVPGQSGPIQPVKMDFRYGTYFGSTPPEAYERLICDCMAGDSTLFTRYDEAIASWSLFTPLIYYWKNTFPENFPNYPAGSFGPHEADALLAKSGRAWREL